MLKYEALAFIHELTREYDLRMSVESIYELALECADGEPMDWDDLGFWLGANVDLYTIEEN